MKQNPRRQWYYWLQATLIPVLLLTVFRLGERRAHAAHTETVQVIYDGSLGTLPATQGMAFTVFDSANPFDVQTIQQYDGGGAQLDSTDDVIEYAGYTRSGLDLDRQRGFTLRFTVQIRAEDHTTSGTADKNGDGVADRAGFSVIAISSDGQYGLEVGFWEDEIWVQEGGTAPELFTHAEGIPFTTTGVITYDLAFHGDSYSLAVADSTILSGSLRDYTALTGPIDPYETPNFLFLGDDTTSAGANISLSYVALVQDEPEQSFWAYLPALLKDASTRREDPTEEGRFDNSSNRLRPLAPVGPLELWPLKNYVRIP